MTMKKIFLYIFLLSLNFVGLYSQADHYQHFIMYGQSLSVGHQSYPVLSTENHANNYMIGNQIWNNYNNTKDYNKFNPLVGNICAISTNQPKTRESGCIAECPLLGTVNHLQLKQPSIGKIVATSCGTSGRSIEDLSKESQVKDHYKDFGSAIEDAKRIANKNNVSIECPVIFWMQGEWNYQGYSSGLTAGSKPTADKEEYKKLFRTLKNNMQTDVVNQYSQSYTPPFITYQVGVQYTKGRYLPIGMAQLELANEESDVICAGPVYQMTDRGGHLDGNGYRWYGEMLAKVYYKTQILKEQFSPLQPESILRDVENRNRIIVKYSVPKLPLVLDTLTLNKQKDYGFVLYKNGIVQTLAKIEVENDCVYLTCNDEIKTEDLIYIVYAGEATQGHGNLRDSDDYEAFFNYVDLDQTKDDGSYLFPRDAGEPTLRPNVEPKDENKELLYDKKYPLYNFSVAFYYRLGRNVEQYDVPNVSPSSISENIDSETTFKFFQRESKIYLEKDIVDTAVLLISDLSGKKIKTRSIPCGESLYEYSFTDFPKGVYLARVIVNENLTKTIKISVK